MNRIVERVRAAARVIAAALLAAVVLLVSWSSIGRYVFNAPVRFAEEVSGLLMIGMLFLAIAGAGKPAHIRVGLLADAVPAKVRPVLAWLAALVLIVFCVVFGWDAVKQAWFNYQRNIRSEIVSWWLWPWAALLPLAMLVVAFDAIVRLVRGERDAPEEARDGT
ncbi:MAG TPA: TRAP transporter small permease [Burkholderiales bacterium]|nr:TRAP transporter small permease [Burkholderiales bacterium]